MTRNMPPTSLAPLASLVAAATPDVEALRAEITKLFDLIDARPEKDAVDVGALELLADSLDEAEVIAAGATPGSNVTTAAVLTVTNPGAAPPPLRQRTNSLRSRVPRTVSGRGTLTDRVGNKIEDVRQLTDTFDGLRRNLASMTDGGRLLIAAADWRDAYPEDRKLGDDPAPTRRRCKHRTP